MIKKIMIPKIALVGRPNVGKSSLFNRLLGKPVALVHPRPGVTRDGHIRRLQLESGEVDLIDTAGWVHRPEGPLEHAMIAKTIEMIEQADALWMVIDDVKPDDYELAQVIRMRRGAKPVMLWVNKCDRRGWEDILYQSYELGLGDPCGISAAHGHGLRRLMQELEECAHRHQGGQPVAMAEGESDAIDEDPSDDVWRVAVVGRPNAGKSSLINRWMGEERLIVSDQPGTTRDSLELPWDTLGSGWRVVDTAGIRRRCMSAGDDLERASVKASQAALKACDIAMLVVDATDPLTHQDWDLAEQIALHHRGVIVVLNKWDLIRPSLRSACLKELREQCGDVPLLRYAPCLPVSAHTTHNWRVVHDTVDRVRRAVSQRIGTGMLNAWLRDVLLHQVPPLHRGRPIKMKYIAQVSVRPARFLITGTRLEHLPESYKRFLIHQLHKVFGFPGASLQLVFRSTPNPFVRKDK